jgi:hypothetical protein
MTDDKGAVSPEMPKTAIRRNVDKVHAALDGVGGLEKADALMLALVEHIEQAAPEHRMELARGIIDVLTPIKRIKDAALHAMHLRSHHSEPVPVEYFNVLSHTIDDVVKIDRR